MPAVGGGRSVKLDKRRVVARGTPVPKTLAAVFVSVNLSLRPLMYNNEAYLTNKENPT